MNPLSQVSREVRKVIAKPVEAVSQLANQPIARDNPISAVIGLASGKTLSDVLADKTVLITGASSGIGEAAAIQVGAAGGNVVLVARSVDKLAETAKRIEAVGGTAHPQPCDLTDLNAIDAMAERVRDEFGGIDILVNNAGRSIRRSLELSYDRFHDYERTMQLNYFAPVRMILNFIPGMRERERGQVINISSVGVQTRVPRFGAYIASKAALDTLCDSLQAETKDQNVSFTTIFMPLVRTPMIAPTRIYDRFPALTPEQAGEVICRSIVNRPRRVSPTFGRAASFADAITPQLMDNVRNRGFKMFGDSNAARGSDGKPASDETVSATGRAFAEVTRGVHW